MFPSLASALLLLFGSAEATIFLANATGPIPGLSSTCISVLNQAVACDEALTSVDAYRFETDETLAKVCVATCATALSTYARRVTGACGSTFWAKDPAGVSYSLLYKVQVYLEKYNLVCLKGSTGAFCNAEIRNQFHIDPASQQMTADPNPSVTCGDCFISAIKTRLQMPLASSSELASSFSSLTSACSKTGLTVTNPATPKTSFIVRSVMEAQSTQAARAGPNWISPTATSSSSPQSTCVGSSYTVKTGDTCQSISQANGFSTAQLMARNGLLGYCQTPPAPGTALCLPDSLRCTAHKLVDTDTCSSLAQSYNATRVKLISWNPELGTYCDRIPKLASHNFSICISTPGGPWVHPYPEDEPPLTSTTSTTETYFTIPSTAFTALPLPTQRDPDQPNLAWVPVYGNGTREDCDVYVTPPIRLNGTLDYTCESTAREYHVSLEEFLGWNPALRNQTACHLSPDEQYCAQFKRLPPPGTTGVTQYCARYQVAEPGSYEYGDCQAYLQSFGISEDRFKEWNGVGCEGFQAGYAYCAAAMHFRPAGQIATCNYWAMANATGSGGCAQYISRFGITQARLVAWNPSIKSDCSGMVKYYDYCIGTPTWHPA